MVRTTALGIGLFLSLVLPAHAAETEVRRFNVSVDGKQSGQYAMTFTNQDDGTLAIACDAHVKVKVAFVTAYHYDYTGTEVWKDGRLLSLKSTCDDDGKKFQVNAVAGDSGLTVTVNGSRRMVRWDVFLTTACCWPDAKRRDGDLPLMESDNGQEISGKIQHIADDTTGSHYRLTSLCQHEVWYDAAGRMVRQEWTEGGHKTVLELAK
jgi:YD repeat-containing protein